MGIDPRTDPAFLAQLTREELGALADVDVEGILSGRTHVHHYAPDGAVLGAFYEAWARYVSIIGPIGSGKTVAAVQKCRDIITDMPVGLDGVRRSRGLVVRQVEADLIRSTIPDWLKVMGSLGTMRWSSPLQQRVRFRGADGILVEALVDFIALDGLTAENAEARAKGIQATWMWVDEAKATSQTILSHLFGRLGRYPDHTSMPVLPGCTERDDRFWYGAILSTNPPEEDHWLARIHESPTPRERAAWSTWNQPPAVVKVGGVWEVSPEAENIRSLPASYYEDKLAGGPKESYIRINLAGMYGVDETGEPVWPTYSSALHDTDTADYVEGEPVYLGVDYGRTPSAVLVQRLGGGYLAFDEFLMTDTAAPRFADELARYLVRRWGLYAEDIQGWDDPAGSNATESSDITAHESMLAEGFRMAPSPIPNADLTGRIKAVTDPMGRLSVSGAPALRIQVRCKGLRRAAAGGYQYRRLQVTGEDRYTIKPDKNRHSHVADGFTCVMAGLGEGQVRSAPTVTSEATRARRAATRRPPNR